jgi:hypothetical protein
LCDCSIFDRFGQLRGTVDSHTNSNSETHCDTKTNRDPDANSETHCDTKTNRHARSNCNPDTRSDCVADRQPESDTILPSPAEL